MNNSTIWWVILIVVVLLGAYFLFVNREAVEAPDAEIPEVSEPVPLQPEVPDTGGLPTPLGDEGQAPEAPGSVTPVE